MKAADVTKAVRLRGLDETIVCSAIRTVLPILEELRDNASGWKFWIRLGLGVAIGALRAYQREAC